MTEKHVMLNSEPYASILLFLLYKAKSSKNMQLQIQHKSPPIILTAIKNKVLEEKFQGTVITMHSWLPL